MTLQRFFRWSAAAVALACLAPAVAGENVEMAAPVKLRFEPRFILDTVAERMKVTLRADVPLPAIFLESTTPLRQFQDAMEGQWQFRPPLIANSYSIATNEIYLSDEASFYRRFKRTLDDSLAHEFVHYIQARYHGEDLTHDGLIETVTGAAAASEAILGVVTSVRSGTNLDGSTASKQ